MTDKMLNEAKKLITEYHLRTFEYTVKSELAHLFHDLRRVPLGYTTAETPDEQAIMATANLVNHSIDIYIDGLLAESRPYSPEDLIGELGNLEFDELMAVDEELLESPRQSVDDLIANATARSQAGTGSGVGKQFDRFS